ncbi:MAG: TonB-dependent receptor [Bacteroidetes bacterium]|nr:TonB-dependent receptor [Bacteroidota bacterium]
MKLQFFTIFLFFFGTMWGQKSGTLTGTITDVETGEPMIAVNISANRQSGTISGEDGGFSLKLSEGDHLVEFYYVGYEMASRELSIRDGENLHVDVEMTMSSNMLDEVVVSAGKFEQKLSDVTVSLEILHPRQLSNQNITSLDMILEKTSGISILNGQPSIRGGSGFSYGVGSRVLMLVDDLPMISGDAGDIKWSFLPVENVNQVEVIKGASSVLYGSSALNGVINLRTRFPGNDPHTDVTLFSGAFMEPRRKEMVWKDRAPLYAGVSFSHLRKIGKLDFSVGGNYFRDEGYRELEHEQRIRGNLALRYRFEKVKGLSAGLSTSSMYTDHADFILWQDADSGAYRQNPQTYARLFGHRFNFDPYVEYFTPGGNRHTLKTRLYSVGNNTVDETKNSFSRVWYGEYRYLKKLGEQIHWTSGVSFMRNTVKAGLFDNHEGSNTAIYSQLDANVLKRLKLSTGIRWEINGLNGELFFANPVVRAGLNYQAAEATYLRASFGQGYRFPSVAEKFVDARTGGLNIFPNPGLEPEHGWSAEVGAKQGFILGSWSGFADLALFWTRYQNMIEYTFGYYPPENPTRPPFDYVGFKALNIETARILGAEFTLNGQGRLGPVELFISAGYTFMDPVDPVLIDSTGRTEDEAWVLKYRRRHLVKSDLEAELRRVFAGINIQYNSKMINVDEAFIHPLLGEEIMPGFPEYWIEEAGAYVLIDLRVGWNISDSFRLNALIKNVTNVEYLGRPGDIGPPRQLTLQARLTF